MFRFTSEQSRPPTTQSEQRPKVSLRQGTFHGIEVKGFLPQHIEQFLGIPYGLPTGGEARFRPPTPVKASSEEYDATSYGLRCPAGPGGPYGEDCLVANIFRPSIYDKSKKLPVVIYFHGGAFNSGFGNVRDMSSFVGWSTEAIIGVSFNYRVGAFGFLACEAAAKEGLLNVGLKDQVLLLRWVQENIALFGGDVDNITLMGNSAGAHSIGHHLFSNSIDNPLFHRVIMESGAATARFCYPYNHPLHEEQFRDFLQRLGCENVEESKLIETLRTYSTEEIKAASDAVFNDYNPSVRWPFQPVIDGKDGTIPIPPIENWKQGNWRKIPILTGFNTNEGAMFIPEQMSTAEEFKTFFQTLIPSLTEQDLVDIENLYPDPILHPDSIYTETRPGLGAQFKRAEQVFGHFAYTAPVRQTAEFASSIPDSPPVYLYHFAASSSVKGGADHGTHSPFVTYSEGIRGVSELVDGISGLMHAYWTSFVVCGDPNSVKGRYGGRVEWPVFVGGRGEQVGKLVVFGEGNDEVAGGVEQGIAVSVKSDGWVVEECRYWEERTGRLKGGE